MCAALFQVGDGRCPVVDTWWQTETGGHMILPLPNVWQQKPGSATLPFFGVVPVLLDEKGNELKGKSVCYLGCCCLPALATICNMYVGFRGLTLNIKP